MKRFAVVIVLCIFLLSSMAHAAAYANPSEILNNASLMGMADRIVYTAEMDIHTPRGSKTRRIEIYREQADHASYRLLAQVVFPAFLTDMKLLIISEDDRVSRWMKTSRGVRSIADSGRVEQIFDSDMDTDDLTDIRSELFNVLLKEDTADSYVIEAVEKSSGYTRVITIDKETSLISRVDYYDVQGRLYKVYELEKMQVLDGMYYPNTSVIRRPIDQTYTVLTFSSIDLPDSIPSRYFNRHQL